VSYIQAASPCSPQCRCVGYKYCAAISSKSSLRITILRVRTTGVCSHLEFSDWNWVNKSICRLTGYSKCTPTGVRTKGEQARWFNWLPPSLFVRREGVLIYMEPLAPRLYVIVITPWIKPYIRTDSIRTSYYVYCRYVRDTLEVPNKQILVRRLYSTRKNKKYLHKS
jgi:hypothetical protein